VVILGPLYDGSVILTLAAGRRRHFIFFVNAVLLKVSEKTGDLRFAPLTQDLGISRPNIRRPANIFSLEFVGSIAMLDFIVDDVFTNLGSHFSLSLVPDL
jgi:hypothetical protein